MVGGSGFIGKSIIDCFKRKRLQKYSISKIIIISRNPKKIRKIFSNFKKIKIIKGDISKTNKLPDTDYYIYLSETSDIFKYKNKKILQNYKKGIKNFSNLLKKDYKKKNILYVSSGSVNNKKNNNYKNYNLIKKNSENTIKKLSNYGFKTSIARCYTFLGEFLPFNKHFAIGNYINDGLNKKFIHVKSNNKVYRSYMYADDLVNWLFKILVFSRGSCPIYNVGSDQPIELGKLANIIGSLLKKPVRRPKITNKKVDKYVPNTIKTKRELNLNLDYSLLESIILTLKKIKKK